MLKVTPRLLSSVWATIRWKNDSFHYSVWSFMTPFSKWGDACGVFNNSLLLGTPSFSFPLLSFLHVEFHVGYEKNNFVILFYDISYLAHDILIFKFDS